MRCKTIEKEGEIMGTERETRIISVNIIVENPDAVQKLNDLLHEYRSYIIGRMGIPYSNKKISVINVVLDAPDDAANALSGRLGMIAGISCKTVRAKR
jgi:putative iron-only hydrogenase system regulator